VTFVALYLLSAVCTAASTASAALFFVSHVFYSGPQGGSKLLELCCCEPVVDLDGARNSREISRVKIHLSDAGVLSYQ
jgi:hypothetical protein